MEVTGLGSSVLLRDAGLRWVELPTEARTAHPSCDPSPCPFLFLHTSKAALFTPPSS